MRKLILLTALIALLATGCTKFIIEPPANSEESQAPPVEETTKKDPVMAPDFELPALDGSTIKLSELRDKKVLLNFWATWCGFCVIEMPDLQKLQESHDDLLVLTVNVGESKETVQKFMEENNLNLTVVLDEKMNIANTYGVRSYPTTIAVNHKGEAVRGYVGMLTYEQMEQLYSLIE